MKAQFSSGLLSPPHHSRKSFSTRPHELDHTHSVGFLQSTFILPNGRNKCGEALSGRGHLEGLQVIIFSTQCPEDARLGDPMPTQTQGSRGQQRLTVLGCPGAKGHFCFVLFFKSLAFPKMRSYRSLISHSSFHFRKMLLVYHHSKGNRSI